MSGWAIAAAIAFGGLFVVTAVAQPRRWHWVSWLKARDACAYIPTWTFFAPNPGVFDTRLVWREKTIDGNLSPWHEIQPPDTGVLRFVWNPHKRARKAINDCVPMILRLVARNQKSKLPMLSLPYLILVHYIAALHGSPLGVARQFAVVRTQGRDDGDGHFELLCVSHWHRQPGESAEAVRPTIELV